MPWASRPARVRVVHSGRCRGVCRPPTSAEAPRVTQAGAARDGTGTLRAGHRHGRAAQGPARTGAGLRPGGAAAPTWPWCWPARRGGASWRALRMPLSAPRPGRRDRVVRTGWVDGPTRSAALLADQRRGRAGLPLGLRGLRLPAAAGHGGRRAGGGHRRGRPARGAGRRRCLLVAGVGQDLFVRWPAALARAVMTDGDGVSPTGWWWPVAHPGRRLFSWERCAEGLAPALPRRRRPVDGESTTPAGSRLRVLVVVEQLRRRVPGGIGTLCSAGSCEKVSAGASGRRRLRPMRVPTRSRGGAGRRHR